MRNTVHAPGITLRRSRLRRNIQAATQKAFTPLNFTSRDELLSWAEKRENTCDAF